jgi:hypothetical protein
MSAEKGHGTLHMLVNGPTNVPYESQCVVPMRVSRVCVIADGIGPSGVRDD